MKGLVRCILGACLLISVIDSRSVPEGEIPEDVKGEESLIVAVADDCQCQPRYFKHYYAKDCTPVYKDGCDCPVRFNCPETFLTNDTVCYYNGNVYGHKEKIPSTNPCQICSCETAHFGNGLEITCVSIECPHVFRGPNLEEGCYHVHAKDQCCPTGVKCDNSTVEGGIAPDEPTCEHDGKLYHLGQYIDTSGGDCMNCVCDENWTGVQGNSCRPIECMLERKRRQLREGCLPIYHESTCCPIEFHCETSSEEIISVSPHSISNDTDPSSECVFGKNKGSVGDILKLGTSSSCVTCTCTTPPEFTCVHRRCPGPPNEDYDNCHPTYTPGECCATYQCVQAAPAPSPVCDPVYCEEGCSEVYAPYGCPMCMCNQVLCSPPKCPHDCVIDYDAKPCPSCKCISTFDLSRPMCGPVKCGPQCQEAISPQGCPMCVCGPLCSPPKCRAGCHVQTDFAEGECPGCVCETDGSATDQVPKILCSPVRCPSYCSEAMGSHGCPMCLCGPMCSPPECGPGCRAEVVPSSGPCPGCVCEPPIIRQCAPVNCPAGCREFAPPNECPLCQCDKVLCSMPKCPSGCDINYDIPPGSCPDCKCPASVALDRPQCGPVKCGPQCHEAISPQGCPMCVCGPLCSVPKCDSGCVLQTNVPDGQCPGCDCPGEDQIPKIQCAPVNCPTFCSQSTNEYGCPMCVCEPLCSPPKCDPGCRAEVVPTLGSCPGCVCDIERPLCGPVKCGPECYETISRQGCPMCVCGPQCSPPRCELGCHIQRNVPDGQCPGCVCDSAPLRAPVGIGQPACSIPRCPPGCPLETIPSSGPCLGCACEDAANTTDVDAFPFCPPMTCGIGCQEVVVGEYCPGCKCNEVCVPHKCPENCEVDPDPPAGACAACKCAMNPNPVKLDCPDMPCQVPCQEVLLTPNSCPVCQCRLPPVKTFLPPQRSFGVPSL